MIKKPKIKPNQTWATEGVRADVNLSKGHRSANHLDLFYDLLIVVAMASTGKSFRAKIHDLEEFRIGPLMSLFAFFMPLWFHSFGLNHLVNRFGDANQLYTMLFYFVSFLCLGVVVMNIERCASDDWLGGGQFQCFDFGIAYASSRFVLAVAWGICAYGTTTGKWFCTACSVRHAIAALLWLVTVLIQKYVTAFLIMWWMTIIVEFFSFVWTPPTPDYIPLDVHLFDERMGLITLIAIGETVAATLTAPLSEESQWSVYGSSFFIMATSFQMLLLYFQVGARIIKEGKHALRSSVIRGLGWSLLHIPLVYSILLVGNAGEILIVGHSPPQFIRAIYGYGVGSVFILSAVMQSLHDGGGSTKKRLSKRVRLLARWCAGAIIISLGLFVTEESGITSPIFTLLVSIVSTVEVMGIDIYGSARVGVKVEGELGEFVSPDAH